MISFFCKDKMLFFALFKTKVRIIILVEEIVSYTLGTALVELWDNFETILRQLCDYFVTIGGAYLCPLGSIRPCLLVTCEPSIVPSIQWLVEWWWQYRALCQKSNPSKSDPFSAASQGDDPKRRNWCFRSYRWSRDRQSAESGWMMLRSRVGSWLRRAG